MEVIFGNLLSTLKNKILSILNFNSSTWKFDL